MCHHCAHYVIGENEGNIALKGQTGEGGLGSSKWTRGGSRSQDGHWRDRASPCWSWSPPYLDVEPLPAKVSKRQTGRARALLRSVKDDLEWKRMHVIGIFSATGRQRDLIVHRTSEMRARSSCGSCCLQRMGAARGASTIGRRGVEPRTSIRNVAGRTVSRQEKVSGEQIHRLSMSNKDLSACAT